MQDWIILASALASIIALITLGRIARQIDDVHTLLSALSKLHRSQFDRIRDKLDIQDPKAGPPEDKDNFIQWKT